MVPSLHLRLMLQKKSTLFNLPCQQDDNFLHLSTDSPTIQHFTFFWRKQEDFFYVLACSYKSYCYMNSSLSGGRVSPKVPNGNFVCYSFATVSSSMNNDFLHHLRCLFFFGFLLFLQLCLRMYPLSSLISWCLVFQWEYQLDFVALLSFIEYLQYNSFTHNCNSSIMARGY